jgi:hypothetical protein
MPELPSRRRIQTARISILEGTAMNGSTRRGFLAHVGKGMVAASIGPALATDLGIGWVEAADEPALNFGPLEALVCLMQETPIARLQSVVVERLRQGTAIRQLVAAAALANARAFGGEDYIGFHTMMALGPAYYMSQELPENRRPLPILKVLYRNTNRIQEHGGRRNEVLHTVEPGAMPQNQPAAEALRDLVRRRQTDASERLFATVARDSADEAFNDVLFAVHDATEVHRVVLPYRSWDLLGIIGREQAHVLLRQSLRYCLRQETPRYVEYFGESRRLVPRLLDEYRLLSRPSGTRRADDGWVEHLSTAIFRGTPSQAADAAAAALAEGFAPGAVSEAITLAANQLALRDDGRPLSQAQPNKPVGSVHGDSIGVHACDSANAWRNIARVSHHRNQVVSLILGAYQAAFDRSNRGGDFLNWQPYPRAEARQRLRANDQASLLREVEDAIRQRDQARACAAVQRYGELGLPARPVFDVLLRYSVSEDGALHAEKFYRTTVEEFQAARPAFRWRYVVALARVTASAYGQPAPGRDEACRLLTV